MLVKTEAIVLHSFKYGESRLIVDMFTREVGRLSFIVPLPKTPKSRLKKQYFQPMTLLEVECDVHQRVQLQKLKDVRLLSAYTSVPFSPEKLALSLFTAEFLYHALRSEQRNEPLFAYVCDAMRWLDAVETGFANFHLTFLMRLSRFLGFYPNLDDYVDGCVFDLRAATFSLQVPTHRDFLQPDDAQRIHTLMRMDFPTMRLYRLSRHDRNRIVDVLLYYYRLHIPQFPELKSLSVLQELWAD
ncbi:MAG: DNA repair protein RecO [Prevotella sp.]|nr:DNA repair protein RecO [Prevotella sp.]MBP3786570.1 DNA repair protein RecO [Prevotella sp.]